MKGRVSALGLVFSLIVFVISCCVPTTKNEPSSIDETVGQQGQALASDHLSNVIELKQNKPPILLVHGFQMRAFNLDEIWGDMAKCLTGKVVNKREDWDWVCDESNVFGYELCIKRLEGNNSVIYISNYTRDTEHATRLDIRFYAQNLAQEIATIKTKENVTEVDIVAFSMGGLVARAYIENEDFNSNKYTTAYRSDVRKLIMVATPNHGFTFPDFAYFLYGLPLWQSSLRMVSGSSFLQIVSGSSFLQELNGGVTGKQKGVEYSAIAGNAYRCNPPVNSLLSAFLCWLYGQRASDGVLTVESVKLENQGELAEISESRWFVIDLTHFELRSELTGRLIEDILNSPVTSSQ